MDIEDLKYNLKQFFTKITLTLFSDDENYFDTKKFLTLVFIIVFIIIVISFFYTKFSNINDVINNLKGGL